MQGKLPMSFPAFLFFKKPLINQYYEKTIFIIYCIGIPGCSCAVSGMEQFF